MQPEAAGMEEILPFVGSISVGEVEIPIFSLLINSLLIRMSILTRPTNLFPVRQRFPTLIKDSHSTVRARTTRALHAR